ncbi:uncharacterized protein METZ01_LOCUS142628 [marine metagenome]|uniref:Uncharacterized protein n=1 Tax=marine metagenome TaxID=408172 RepID=A0A381ZKV1_9ZZZZ
MSSGVKFSPNRFKLSLFIISSAVPMFISDLISNSSNLSNVS